jgi:ubiquinone/menaquinone biosynthesis C-methylase UbiE
MDKKFTMEEVRQYWTSQSDQYGLSYEASWSDMQVIEKEIIEISKYLSDNDNVLDVGCANGYSTIQWAAEKQISIKGLDYIPGMIENARKRLAGFSANLRGAVYFDQGNILSLDEASSSFDKVIVVRVIINLGDWERQIQGMLECARLVKPGGLLLMSEATMQGWEKLNLFRSEWGLDQIPIPPFNTYLDEVKVIETLQSKMELIQIVNFASTYFVGTRVIKPLLARLLGMEEKVAEPSMHWNKWFAQIPSFGDYGTQKLFIFKKR